MSLVNATGATLSSTVTTASAVLTFPFVSVTVSVTVLAPTFTQLKLAGETLSDAIPQLSLLPLSIWVAVIEALPVASNWTVMDCVTAVGATVSTTVTTAVSVLTLPFTSVTVNVTVLFPTLAQLKLLGATLNDAIPQLSLLPASTSPNVIDVLPFASSCAVMS